MDNFKNTVEPPRQPFAMKVVGTGVILSCLLLCFLFAWGIYLDLNKQDCVCPQTASTASQLDT
ncbi:MAG: hypothetical protein F4W90_02550 [Gammaproteobacteria bacterium]|nr:hypothetical protein [Gammaproteobacteria bacterium]